jgi:Trehalose utilisation
MALLSALLITANGLAGTPKKLLLIGQGPDGHPPQTHEYMAGLKVLAKCLKPVSDLEITTVRADGAWKEGPDLVDRADGVVLYLAEGARWINAQPDRRKAFERLAARGGGLAALHWAIGTREAGPIDPFLRLLGGCHGGPDRKYAVVEAEATIADPGHEIAHGVSSFRVRDEFYYRLKFIKPSDGIHPILQVPIEGAKETVC